MGILLQDLFGHIAQKVLLVTLMLCIRADLLQPGCNVRHLQLRWQIPQLTKALNKY